MKVVAFLFATLTVVAAFAPAQHGRAQSILAAAAPKKPTFFQTVFGMDLFAPVSKQNDYGARGKKNLKMGTIGANSYVPEGLSLAQYNKIRGQDKAKKDKNYQRNVSKAGKYQGYDEFYIKRGTDTSDAWIKTEGRGHTFAKTKFDFSGKKQGEDKNYDGGV
eukprot:CAMPEP_0119006278 /NCGR_PEP_ID=MMETSP1176-20130426/2203_1 /TAXON_ID=265551 /ORGANISM="Synedropsis recta cf, Strain CCMP1620" /LENGTH=161 /DNA_ID=CAMNT_0006958177 /DNA_START=64 /DNA_END=549 /DNA_ORIENTATION=-